MHDWILAHEPWLRVGAFAGLLLALVLAEQAWPRRDGAQYDVVAGGRRDRFLPHLSVVGESQRG